MIVLYVSRNLTGLTNRADAFEVEGHTVCECLDDLVSMFPLIKNELFSSSGSRLHDRVQVRVNRRTIEPGERLTKQVKDGDQIEIALKGH